MRLLAQIAAAALLAAGPAGLASAEIYRWTDAQGNVHFTQDLSQVPASARDAAERSARRETQRSAPSPASAATGTPARSSGRALQIPFEKQGNAMIVYVRINDAITAPFIVDTGASDVLVPAHLAAAAGIQIGRDTPHRTYQTANGLIDTPVVTLASVQVGDARIENVPGSVSGAMTIGLLGGTFFNNYTFQIDPAENVITLFPNAHVRGGSNQAEWRARYRELQGLIAVLDAHLEGAELTDPARVRVLEQRRQELGAALDGLEEEANLAGVPQAWRD
jgi:aspartyl protease family protein